MYAGRIVETAHRRRAVRAAADAVLVGPARLAAADRRRPRREAAHDRGHAAGADLAAGHLPLQPALPLRPGHLQRARADADRAGDRAATSRAAGRPSPTGGSHDRDADRRARARRGPVERPGRGRGPQGLLPDPLRHLPAGRRVGEGRRRRVVHDPPRRDAGAGRRVGLRQEHDRAGADPAPRAHGGQGDVRRRRPDEPQARRPARRCAAACRSSSRTRTARSTRG